MATHFPALTPSARLSDRVGDALAAEIRAGGLREGDRLPTEAALAKQFAVSRTVVREAVSHLRSLGIIDSRQGSGMYVRGADQAPLHFETSQTRSKTAVIQMAEVRRALEAEVAALAALRRTKTDLVRIHRAIEALDEAVGAGRDGVREDVAFHQQIAAAARNPFLSETLQYMGRFLHGATRVTRANEARRVDFAQAVTREHGAIVAAIEAGNAVRARRAASRHMDNAIRRIKQADAAFWLLQGEELASALLDSVSSDQR